MEFSKHPKDLGIKENQSARFDCELNKRDIPVTWYRNGEKIEKEDKNVTLIDDGKCHSLILKKCDPSYIGKYTVKTTGPFSSASLFIEGRNFLIKSFFILLRFNVN